LGQTAAGPQLVAKNFQAAVSKKRQVLSTRMNKGKHRSSKKRSSVGNETNKKVIIAHK
jgi:hypothetical protein